MFRREEPRNKEERWRKALIRAGMSEWDITKGLAGARELGGDKILKDPLKEKVVAHAVKMLEIMDYKGRGDERNLIRAQWYLVGHMTERIFETAEERGDAVRGGAEKVDKWRKAFEREEAKSRGMHMAEEGPKWEDEVAQVEIIAAALQIKEVWQALAPGSAPEERWNPEGLDPQAMGEAIVKVADVHKTQKGRGRQKEKLKEWMAR